MFKNLYYGWWVVLACFTIGLYVSGVTFFGFTAFFEPIQREFGWSYAQISLASSLRGFEVGILAPLVGFLVDRFGSRKLLLGGNIVIAIGLILMSLTTSLPMFYLSILFIALGAGGCTSVVVMTAVAIWFKKNVGLALGIVSSGFGAGGAIIPFIVYLIDATGWRTTVVILAAGMLLLGVPLSLLVRDPSEELEATPGKPARPRAVCIEEESAGKKSGDFREMIRSRSFLYLNATEAARMVVIVAVATHLMPYLSSIGMSRTSAGAVAAAVPLVSIVGRFGFGWCSDRFDKRFVLAATFLLMSAGVFSFCYVQSLWVLILFVLLFAPGFGGGIVLRGAMLREYFGMSSFGKMLGIVLWSGSIGGIIGPTLAGWMFDILGSYTLVWYGSGAISGVCIFLSMRIKPTLAPRETP